MSDSDNIFILRKCVFCGLDTFQKIIKFTSETLKKCETVLEYRRTKPVFRKSRTTYDNIELSAKTSINQGYHAQCYKLFTAIKVPVDYQKSEQQERAAICDNESEVSGENSESRVPVASTTTQAAGSSIDESPRRSGKSHFSFLDSPTMSASCKLYTMDTEKVINEVRIRECLWNVHHKAYKNKLTKRQAWKEVCEVVAPDYSTSSNVAKRQIEKSVQARWKTARDAYMKCRAVSRKKKYRGEYKYIYYDELTFLENTKYSEAEITDESMPATSPQNLTDPLEETEHVTVPSKNPPRRVWRRTLLKRKTMSDFETQLLKVLENRSSANSNSALKEDDQHFFNSLAPIINEFDSYKKIVFRSRILELAMDIGDIQQTSRMKNEPQNYDAQEEESNN